LNDKIPSTGDVPQTVEEAAGIQWLDSSADIQKITGLPGSSGDFGYVNWRSGWADAEATMRWLRAKVEATGRVTFLTGSVKRLLFNSSASIVSGVEYVPHQGVQLNDDQTILQANADLVVLAAGAWTPTLLNVQGHAKATAQTLAYIPLTDAQAERFSKTPVTMNMSTGFFIMPPPPPNQAIAFPDQPERRRLFLKLARHEHGYANPSTIQNPEPHSSPDSTVETSIPRRSTSDKEAKHTIPQDAFTRLEDFLHTLLPDSPELALSSDQTRLCHYTDTPTGDFIFAYHPRYNKSLFIATGGSGHAFKFVPVLGESGVQCIEGRYPAGFEKKWAWKEKMEGDWAVEDGSRGGEQGLSLDA
jgi:sarcosine oxidase/L-pipecolate oxidase